MIFKKGYNQPVVIGLIVIIIVILPVFAYFSSIENDAAYDVTDYRIYESSLFDKVENEIHTGGNILNLGFQREINLSFNIKNALNQNDTDFFLEIKNPTFREVSLYIKDDEGDIKFLHKAGTEFGRSNLFSSPNPIFGISSEISNSEEFFLTIKSFEPINFKITATPQSSFYFNYNQRTLFISVYIGVMFALFLYNFILYFLLRDHIYFIYSSYIFFIALAQLSLLGYSYYYFLAQNPRLYELSIIGFSAISGVVGITFMRMFLKTRKFTPLLDKLLIFNIILYIIAFGSRLLDFNKFSYTLTDISGLLVTILFIFSAVIIVRKGYRPAIYFLIGWIMFFTGLVVFILQNQGLINLDSTSNIPMLVGTALEAILLSLALADKINILKKEKEQEQHDRLEAVKENERLIREQNLLLEEKVKNRTHELEVTLRNLQNTQTQLVNQEKMASLGQLTAGVAHEINNPINFVSSNINPLKRDISDVIEIMDAYRQMGIKEFSPETLKQLNNLEKEIDLDYVRDEIDQLLQGMEDGAKRTVEIVKGLKLFSRVDEQDVKKVDLHAGISSTLVLLNSSMSNKIKIIKDFGDVPMVDCLAGKINQVFMNIVNNAVHALTENLEVNPNPVIVIKTSTEGEYAKIEIIDNGPGIPDHVKERIFEPFFTTKAVGKGTGLGLSIVYSIIEKHHGTLDVESVPDAGTSFIIKLPITQKTSMI